MKILADENIPLLESLFGTFGDVIPVSGSDITPRRLKGVEALLVRSVTPVDEALIAGSSLRFVGSATAGIDHIELPALVRRGIRFAHAPGSNADSVADYVLCALLVLAAADLSRLADMTIGVVGVGNVGKRVARRSRALGMRVACCDPPRVIAGDTDDDTTSRSDFLAFHELLDVSDVVTLHVPLERGGEHPTWHLVGAEALRHARPNVWLLNTARGSVVDNRALLDFVSKQTDARCVLDVWEGEPLPDVELMRRADVGTPHIAGYSWDAKVAGARAVARDLSDHLGIENEAINTPLEPVRLSVDSIGLADSELAVIGRLARAMYDIEADARSLQDTLGLSSDERSRRFRELRRDYPSRRGFEAHVIRFTDPPTSDVVRRLSAALNVRTEAQVS